MLKPLLLLSSLVLSGAFAGWEQAPAPQAAAPIPAEATQLVNPVKATPELMAKAEKTWGFDCAICHGAKGDGKGDIASSLKTKLSDFTDPASLKGKTDGELFWIIKNGHGEMPSENGRAKEDTIWSLVLYCRTLSGKPAIEATAAAQ